VGRKREMVAAAEEGRERLGFVEGIRGWGINRGKSVVALGGGRSHAPRALEGKTTRGRQGACPHGTGKRWAKIGRLRGDWVKREREERIGKADLFGTKVSNKPKNFY
jgi:hypothetical protein